MTAFVFPGQGAQFPGMGKDLFSLFPDLTKEANTILQYDIAELCIHGGASLNQTNFTQPALYVINSMYYFKHKLDSNIKPEYVLGHSLGEYNAYLAANIFDFATGLRLVQKRGELMSRVKGGAMAAIIGPTGEEVTSILHHSGIQNISIANFNSYTQTVISGQQKEILESKKIFENNNAIFFPLNVSGAFHSPFMNEVQAEFAQYIEQIKFNSPQIPVIANITGAPLSPEDVSINLVEQLTHPVKWLQSILWLKSKNVSRFEELGPGRILSGLIQKIQQLK